MFKNWLETKTGTAVNLDLHVILLGDPHLSVLLIVKWYIYSCKHTKQTLNFMEIINIIKYESIEKFILSEKVEVYAHNWDTLQL